MKTVTAKAKYSDKAKGLFKDREMSRAVFTKILEANKDSVENRRFVVGTHVVVTQRKR